MMHAAKLANSPRLQRVHALLADGQDHSSLDIALQARAVAPGTYVSELRANGAEIQCRQITSHRGERIWLYRMTRPAREA